MGLCFCFCFYVVDLLVVKLWLRAFPMQLTKVSKKASIKSLVRCRHVLSLIVAAACAGSDPAAIDRAPTAKTVVNNVFEFMELAPPIVVL